MPVTLTPARRSLVTRDEIRITLRDFAGRIDDTGEFNIMLDGVQFSDREIDNAIRFTVSRYNGITPITNITADQINDFTLLCGIICFLLNSESFRQVRNQATIQDGDVPQIGVDDKAPLYAQLASMVCNEFKETAKAQKIQRNMENAYGSIASGYTGTSRNSRG
jgi:hypothetical protein